MSHAIIIGAGVSGLTTAYYLAKKGLKVTVLEASQTVANGASGANAGQLSYAYVNPIASPEIWKKLPSMLLAQNPALRVNHWSARTLLWSLKMLGQTSEGRFDHNRKKLLELSLSSKDLLLTMLDEEGLNWKTETKGKLHLYDTQESLDMAREFSDELYHRHDIVQHMLSPDQCVALSPVLEESETDFLGGIYSPIDRAGDCEQYCKELASYLQQSMENVEILTHQMVLGWKKEGNKIRAVKTQSASFEADHFVVCTGEGSNRLLRSLSVSLPILGVKGYTLVGKGERVLQNNITFHKHHVVAAPLASGVRVSGLFQFGAKNTKIQLKSEAYLRNIATKILPSVNWREAKIEAGLRPCTPSSLPIVGQLKYDNLWTNTGHGMLGWTLAHGCAHNVAETIVKSA